jgi:hypothetical protein
MDFWDSPIYGHVPVRGVRRSVSAVLGVARRHSRQVKYPAFPVVNFMRMKSHFSCARNLTFHAHEILLLITKGFKKSLRRH